MLQFIISVSIKMETKFPKDSTKVRTLKVAYLQRSAKAGVVLRWDTFADLTLTQPKLC